MLEPEALEEEEAPAEEAAAEEAPADETAHPFLRALLFCGAVQPGQVGQDVLAVLDAIETDAFPFGLECVVYYRWANLEPGEHHMRIEVLDAASGETTVWLELELAKETAPEYELMGCPLARIEAPEPTVLWFHVFLDGADYGWFPLPLKARDTLGLIDEV